MVSLRLDEIYRGTLACGRQRGRCRMRRGTSTAGLMLAPEGANPGDKTGDIVNAKKQNVDSYVATPEGSLKKFDVSTGNITTLRTDIPSDPKHPARINSVNPGSLPKDEPTYSTWGFIKHNVILPLMIGASKVK